MPRTRKTQDEWEIQGLYCNQWEMVTTESSWPDAKVQVATYRANENVPFRVVKKRVRLEIAS